MLHSLIKRLHPPRLTREIPRSSQQIVVSWAQPFPRMWMLRPSVPDFASLPRFASMAVRRVSDRLTRQGPTGRRNNLEGGAIPRRSE
jgi:hypothetical protein